MRKIEQRQDKNAKYIPTEELKSSQDISWSSNDALKVIGWQKRAISREKLKPLTSSSSFSFFSSSSSFSSSSHALVQRPNAIVDKDKHANCLYDKLDNFVVYLILMIFLLQLPEFIFYDKQGFNSSNHY